MSDGEAERRHNFSLMSGNGNGGPSAFPTEWEREREREYQRQRYHEQRRHVDGSGPSHSFPSFSVPVMNTPPISASMPAHHTQYPSAPPSSVSPPLSSSSPISRYVGPRPSSSTSQYWMTVNQSQSSHDGRRLSNTGRSRSHVDVGTFHPPAPRSSFASSSVSPQLAQPLPHRRQRPPPLQQQTHSTSVPAPPNNVALPSREQVHGYLVSHMAQEKGLDTDWRVAGAKFDVYALFGAVVRAGGSTAVTSREWWHVIGGLLGLPMNQNERAVGQHLQIFFLKMLGGLEILWERTKTGEEKLVQPTASASRPPLPTPMTATTSESGTDFYHARERHVSNVSEVSEQAPRQSRHPPTMAPSSAAARPSWVTASAPAPAPAPAYSSAHPPTSSSSRSQTQPHASSSSSVYQQAVPRSRSSPSSGSLAPITSYAPHADPIHPPAPLQLQNYRLPGILGNQEEVERPQSSYLIEQPIPSSLSSTSAPLTSLGSPLTSHDSQIPNDGHLASSSDPPNQLSFGGRRFGEYVVPKVSSFRELVASNILPLPQLNEEVSTRLGPWTGDLFTVYSKRCHELGHSMNKLQKGGVDATRPVLGDEIVFWTKLLAIMRRNPSVVPPRVEDPARTSQSPIPSHAPAPPAAPLTTTITTPNGRAAPGSFENPLPFEPPPSLLFSTQGVSTAPAEFVPKKRSRPNGSRNKPAAPKPLAINTSPLAPTSLDGTNTPVRDTVPALTDIPKSSTPAADVLRMLQGRNGVQDDELPSSTGPANLHAALNGNSDPAPSQSRSSPSNAPVSPIHGTPEIVTQRLGSIIPSSQDLSPSKKRIDLSGKNISVAKLRPYDNTPTRILPRKDIGGPQFSPLATSQRSQNGRQSSPSFARKKTRGPRDPYKKSKLKMSSGETENAPAQRQSQSVALHDPLLPHEEVENLAQTMVSQIAQRESTVDVAGQDNDHVIIVDDSEDEAIPSAVNGHGAVLLPQAEDMGAGGGADVPARSISAALTPRKRAEPVIELMSSRRKQPRLVRAPIDRAKVVIPIRRRRREELIQRGCYDAFRDDDSEDETFQKRRAHVSLRPMKITLSRGPHAKSVRPQNPEPVPLRFLYRPGSGLVEPYASILTEHSVLRRCTEHACGWKGCDAVLGSEDLLRRHVEMRVHAKQGKMQVGISHWIFGGGKKTMETQLVPGQWLYRCFWRGCEEPCFDTEGKLVQHMMARHVSRVLDCPYEGCDLTSPTISHLTRHVMKTHDEPTDIARPLADLSANLAPPPSPPPLPEVIRTDELTTPLVIGSSYRLPAQVERLRYKILTHCFAGDDPVIHVEHPPHMLEKVGTETPLSVLADIEDDVDENDLMGPEGGEKPRGNGERGPRLLDQVLGRKRKDISSGGRRKGQRWELVVELPTRKKSKLSEV
ncbi:hypothetical protein IAR55_005862 [Kwoniella newhampshirensis]|uniref:ARID domain-containing protein n=1 Tax=Kwoniella newhampshirensis TaxID=1651941 RepID=A0AAW0YHH3_9TREE